MQEVRVANYTNAPEASSPLSSAERCRSTVSLRACGLRVRGWLDNEAVPILEEQCMSDHTVRQVVLSTDDLDESIRFYTETLGFTLKFRDGTHYAALDGGSITIALATAIDHPLPGKVVVGIRTDDVDGAVKSIEANGGAIVRAPYDDAHERRAVVYDNQGNGLVFYKSL